MFFFIFIPCGLIFKQPDLGTAILILISGILVLFLSGISISLILFIFIIIIIFSFPIFYFFIQEYQINRIKVFFSNEIYFSDIGYHVLQSKIAIGSGGLYGKGWMNGSQSQLDFLPERHTDFIFSVLAEEFGLIGILILFSLYFFLILRVLKISFIIRSFFHRLVIISFTINNFFYILINIGMVSGILPIVGIPLPILSYGGSSLIIFMAEFGIIMSITSYYKKTQINQKIWPLLDLNQRPSDYESLALTTELKGLSFFTAKIVKYFLIIFNKKIIK